MLASVVLAEAEPAAVGYFCSSASKHLTRSLSQISDVCKSTEMEWAYWEVFKPLPEAAL